MSKFILSKAMGNIPDDMLMEAMEVKKATGRRWIIRAAACAAVLALLIGTMFFWPVDENYVTGPGVLVVRAYETDTPTLSDEDSSILKEGITVPMEYDDNPAYSVLSKSLGLPFRFSVQEDSYEDKVISFEIWLSGGDFEHIEYMADFLDYFTGKDDTVDSYDVMRARYLGKHFTISNNKRIWWNETGHIFDEQNREVHYVGLDTERVFVDVILRADKYIIGYAVIEIVDVDGEEGFVYHTRMLKSVSFPQVNGKYQKVSEKHVQEQIQLVHDQA